MEKKSILMIIIICILLGVCCILGLNLFTQNQVQIGETYFILPDGYHEAGPNNLGDMTITNGSHTFYISEYNSSDINKYITDYCKFKEKDNYEILKSNFTVGNVLVYKVTTANYTDNVHYWFINNEKVYSVYSLTKNPEMENIVKDLVNSLNFSLLRK